MKVSILIAALLVSSPLRAEVIAFIGSPLAAELQESECGEHTDPNDPSVTYVVMCLHNAFKLKYSVKEVLAGDYAENEIQFIGYYHYGGMPSYTMYEPALLILATEKDFLYMDEIWPAEERENGWWICDEWSETEDGDCLKERSVTEVIEDYSRRN